MSSTEYATLSIAVFAPIPRASVRAITAANTGFFANTRTTGNFQETQNQYANKNVGVASAWLWARDESVRVRNASSRFVNSGRITSQVTPRNKVGFYMDYTVNCSGSAVVKDSGQCRSPGDNWTAAGPGIGPGVFTTSPESGTIWNAPLSIMQATWTSPISSRFLFESGYSDFRAQWGDVRPEGAITNLIPVQEQSNAVNPVTGLRYAPVANYVYRGIQQYGWAVGKTDGWQATASYVTGANSMKFGYEGSYLVEDIQNHGNDLNLAYTLNGGLPVVLQPVASGRGAVNVAQFKGQSADEFRAEDFIVLAPLRPAATAARFNATGEWCVATSGSSIAVTYTWQWSNGEIESDTVFNSRLPWFIAAGEGDGCLDSTARYDLANIAVHEFGHTYGLGHAADGRWETMYPFGFTGETLKRSLGAGDTDGIRARY